MESPKRSVVNGVAAAVLACSPPKSKLKVKEEFWHTAMTSGAPWDDGEAGSTGSMAIALTATTVVQEAIESHFTAKTHVVPLPESASAVRQKEAPAAREGRMCTASAHRVQCAERQ
ncbi:hypothetical protein NDU88_003136 [Pleurodeles waltl]|uniref:Uncharacterized protein n=1 Tax=Pleurodeles waltl TaxID=8319 RepID=A0AAV7SDZ4_PLEWA|nr:hypothetical protein NDU88_003136 [Pleurodeles waltl]